MRRLGDIWKTMRERWRQAMPTFFKRMMMVFACVGGAAITVHLAFKGLDITPHEWWNDVLPYLVGISVGGCFVCKFTVAKGKVDIPHIPGYDKEQNLEN